MLKRQVLEQFLEKEGVKEEKADLEEREALRREKKERRREEKRARKERKHQKRQKNVSSSTEESPAKKPQVVPICTECLGTEACNTTGEAEALVSCWGCGQSVHPSCRVYATELVAYFEQHGWTCDDCKACIVCDQSPSESEKISWSASTATREFTIHALPLSLKNVQRFGTA